MRKIKILTKSVVVFLFIFFTASAATFAYPEEQAVSFQFNGKDYRIEVRLSETGSDILMTTAGEMPKNLSFSLPGENLFPGITKNEPGNRFAVYWMHYRRDDVQLGYYDSQTNESRLLPLVNFKYAYPLRVVFYNDIPCFLLFKGNNSDNTDIFYYHLEKGGVKNITQTPDSEQVFDILDEENRIFIETDSLFHHYRYRIKKRSLKIKLTKKLEIERDGDRQPAATGVFLAINTIAAFGDSITWGRMNMDDLEGDYHPELAYLAQLQEILADNYGETGAINLGYPGDTAFDGIQRMDEVFSDIDAFFCLVMFGTNDVIQGIDPDATVQNLEYIVTRAMDNYKMYPIVSTIPPQRRYTPDQYRKDQTEALNDRIIEMAVQNDIPYIDTYTTFMNYPGGWLVLLEDIKGNHPSPPGHRVIAGLFQGRVLEPPPAKPEDVVISVPGTSPGTIEWSANEEFDFSHYLIEFGYSRSSLNRTVTTPYNYYRFIPPPMVSPFDFKIYFRICSVDMEGYASEFTEIGEIEFD